MKWLWMMAFVLVPAVVQADPPQRAPVIATLTGPAAVRPGQAVMVVLRVQMTKPMDLALDVTWTVPAGAKPIQPKTLPLRLQVKRAKEVKAQLRFQLTGIPAADLLVAVDVKGGDFGVHATAAYRFGRPEPKLENPLEKAAPVKLRGKLFGTGIEVQ